MSVFRTGSSMGSLLNLRESLSKQPKIERSPESLAELNSVIAQILQLDLSPSLPPVEKKDSSETFPNPNVHLTLKKKREETEGDNNFQEPQKKRTYTFFSEERIEFHPIKNPLKRVADESSGVDAPSQEAKKRKFDISSSKELIDFHPIKDPRKRMAEESSAAPAYKKSRVEL